MFICSKIVKKPKMSFSGKRYRRVRCENIDTFMKTTNTCEKTFHTLQNNAPVFSFTRVDETTMQFVLETEDKIRVHRFTLGEEHEMERMDGSKVKLTYTLEGDNILNQTIKQPDGKVSYFRREFSEKDTKMIITNEGTDTQAVIYYEVLE